MLSSQNLDIFEYHSLLTYYGIMSTGKLSESDLDYLVFRLKIISTSLNADSAAPLPPLFELNTAESTLSNSEQLLFQPLTTKPQTTPSNEWPVAVLSETELHVENVHMCDFHDDLSPCWSLRCELWQHMNDGLSWMCQNNNAFSENMTTKHAADGSQTDVGGKACPVDLMDLFVHAMPEEQPDYRESGLDASQN